MRMGRAERDEDRRMEKFEDVLGRWRQGRLSQAEAGELLGKSERQFRRYVGAYEASGLAGLKDGRLGRASGNATPEAVVEAIRALYRSDYRGWNVKHFHEHLVARHGFTLSYSVVKNYLQAADLVRVERHRGPHRRKRERKPCAGMMLHQDGSREVWLEGQPALDLIVTMDDATSEIYSAFLVEEEGTVSTFQGLLDVFAAKGLPASLYTDRGSHYFYTPEAGGKVDKSTLTQVGRALDRLGVEHIPAYSPEARGRSERMFGTLQDRLIKELRLAGITEVEVANRWIAEVYLPEHNARFARAAALPDSGFVAVERAQLVEALCIEEERTVGRDNTVAWDGRRLQVPESPLRHHYVGCRVKVHVYPDGTLALLHGPRVIARFDAQQQPTQQQLTQQQLTGAPRPKPPAGSAAPVVAVARAKSPSAISAAARVAACSTASRRGLAAVAPASPSERRPSLTRPARAAKGLPSRNDKVCPA
jgi:transposase